VLRIKTPIDSRPDSDRERPNMKIKEVREFEEEEEEEKVEA
jgi:hypothetical protein